MDLTCEMQNSDNDKNINSKENKIVAPATTVQPSNIGRNEKYTLSFGGVKMVLKTGRAKMSF